METEFGPVLSVGAVPHEMAYNVAAAVSLSTILSGTFYFCTFLVSISLYSVIHFFFEVHDGHQFFKSAFTHSSIILGCGSQH